MKKEEEKERKERRREGRREEGGGREVRMETRERGRGRKGRKGGGGGGGRKEGGKKEVRKRVLEIKSNILYFPHCVKNVPNLYFPVLEALRDLKLQVLPCFQFPK